MDCNDRYPWTEIRLNPETFRQEFRRVWNDGVAEPWKPMSEYGPKPVVKTDQT
jgi:hypothetical protein